MRRRRKRRHNPVDATTYWVLLGGIVVAGVAIWAWKNMSATDRAKTGIGKPMRPPMIPSLVTLSRLARAA